MRPERERPAGKHWEGSPKACGYCNQDGVLAWPGDLDLAADAMYKEIKANGEWVLG